MKRVILITIAALVLLVAGAAAVLLVPAREPNTDISERIAACQADSARKQGCFEELLRAEAEERGVGAGLDALGLIYQRDQSFVTFCHANTHELGVIAYDLFSAGKDITLSDKTSYCGFGFFHGFLEGLFAHSNDLGEARRFCEYVENELLDTLTGVSFACYHGVGHGIVEGAEPEHWGNTQEFIQEGLDLCEALSPVEEHKERCASGVFNALAIVYRNPTYELSSDPEDPFAICRVQKTRYAREACHDQMNSFIVATHEDFADALRVAATADAEYRIVAVSSAAAFRAQSALASPEMLPEFIEECSALEGELSDACARGFAGGLIEFGKPGEETMIGLDVCARASARTKACLEGIANGVRDRLPPARHEPFCVEVASRFGDSRAGECRAIISSRYRGS